jgi:hypothetical protein
LKNAIHRLQETLSDAEDESEGQVLGAYNGLDLHPEIARASTALYQDGHYAHAV